MKVQKSPKIADPKYPSIRQLSDCTALLGAAALGLGALSAQADTLKPQPGGPPIRANEAPIALGGMVAVEPPPPPPRLGGVPRPPMDTNCVTKVVYVAQKGDTMSSIARTQLGNEERWREIAKLNPRIKPDAVTEGQVVVLPAPPVPPTKTNDVPRVEVLPPPPKPEIMGLMPMPEDRPPPPPPAPAP